jgi:Zn-dependent peptidase ImmA (M78 family)
VNAVEKLAELLLDRLGVNGPPDLFAIAIKIGLRIKEVEVDGFDGTLVRALDAPKGIIAINSRIREYTRKRFAIGHEIGHYLIPHHQHLENVCRPNTIERWHSGISQTEREANEFSAELLLPRKIVAPLFGLNDPTLERIRKVAAEFSTSLTATAYRFVELTDKPCCLVWSERNRTQWYVPSATFRIPLPVSELPSPHSMAAKLFAGEHAPDQFVEVPQDTWLNRWDAHRVRRVLEHSVALSSYKAVLSFLEFELEHEKYEDDERSELLAELDPNRYDSVTRRKPT